MRGDVDVIVVGGGIAGLAAAERLASAGLNVRLLEARARLGGRAWTVRPADVPFALDLGAEFLHGDAPELTRLAERARVALVDVPKSHWKLHRGSLRAAPGFQASITDVLKRAGRVATANPRDLSFADALARTRVREPARMHALAFVEGFHVADPRRISARVLGGEDLGSERVRRVVGGVGEIVRALEERLPPASLQMRARVSRIEWRRGSVRVTVHGSDGRSRDLRAPRAVVALPSSVLAARPTNVDGIEFVPRLHRKADALAKLATGSVVKLTLSFREIFWPDVPDAQNGIGFVHSPDAAFQAWWTPHPTRFPIATCWAGGDRAERLRMRTEREIVSLAVDHLAQCFRCRPSPRELLRAWWWHDWNDDPRSVGAYSYVRVGGSRAPSRLAEPLERTLFFAGEATCTHPDNGTLEGAFTSGLRAARQVLESQP
jgi:monoamine oxidase